MIGEDIPENFGRGEYVGHTVLHPVGLAAVIVLGVAMVVLPRRLATIPMLIMACFIAPAQRVMILGLNFDLLRVMVVFGYIRLAARGEWADFQWKPLDTSLLLFAASAVTVHTFLIGTMEAFINRLGYAYNAVGMYFLFRALIRNWEDVGSVLYATVVISVPVAAAFLVENQTGRNAFAFLGGVPEFTAVRNDRLRCQGAFAHPILAGCFWASLAPLMASLWWYGVRSRPWAVLGLAMSCVIIVCCASSTPLTALLFAGVGACVFPLRTRMRPVRWAIVLGLAGLHLIMKAPVWHLLARVDLVGGSTGWHRYKLIDEAIKHLDEWWLIGTQSTYHWDVWGMYDITNQYVFEGVNGGVITLALFVATIVQAFAAVGRLLRACARDRCRLVVSWALGVALFVHCMNYFAVSYFGQMILVWYLTLAVIGSLAPLPGSAGKDARVPDPDGVSAPSRGHARLGATPSCQYGKHARAGSSP